MASVTFGSAAQTCAQRAAIVRQMLAYYAQIHRKLPLHADALHQRYVAGELSWADVCALRDRPSAASPDTGQQER